MSGPSRDIDRILNKYRNQVLRWNNQINLVSRQNTAVRLDGLIQQCRDGWDLVSNRDIFGFPRATGIWYFDLGSGAGLPGAVWHAQMLAAALPVNTLLVEPREKRAWFLDRIGRLVGPESLEVAGSRWGETSAGAFSGRAGNKAPSHIIISLKALHLPDTGVLRGLVPFLDPAIAAEAPAASGIQLVIARFYPPDQIWSENLAAELEILPAGRELKTPAAIFKGEGGLVLAPTTPRGASLVISRYLIQAS